MGDWLGFGDPARACRRTTHCSPDTYYNSANDASTNVTSASHFSLLGYLRPWLKREYWGHACGGHRGARGSPVISVGGSLCCLTLLTLELKMPAGAVSLTPSPSIPTPSFSSRSSGLAGGAPTAEARTGDAVRSQGAGMDPTTALEVNQHSVGFSDVADEVSQPVS